MTDTSFTGVFDNEVHYLLKKLTYNGKTFHLLDLASTHTAITGNKAWKLKHNLIEWKASGLERILTFGGAYSNHIYQTAKLGHHLGIPAIGMIRGEIDDRDNPTLADARAWGMQLIAVDRSTYRMRNDPAYLQSIQEQYLCFIVPEGGTNAAAIKGTTELGIKVNVLCDESDINQIALAIATGGTMAGIVNGTSGKHVLGYGVLKGDFIKNDLAQWLSPKLSTWAIEDDQIFGGYGKWNDDLINFIHSFYDQTSVILDPIYTGKMMYAAYKSNRLTDEWLYIHTGGIQGNRGFNQRFGLNLPTS